MLKLVSFTFSFHIVRLNSWAGCRISRSSSISKSILSKNVWKQKVHNIYLKIISLNIFASCRTRTLEQVSPDPCHLAEISKLFSPNPLSLADFLLWKITFKLYLLRSLPAISYFSLISMQRIICLRTTLTKIHLKLITLSVQTREISSGKPGQLMDNSWTITQSAISRVV